MCAAKENALAVRYEADGTDIELNPAVVVGYMIDPKDAYDKGGNPIISNRELARVIMTCKARRLNPFTGDVVVQPRKNRDGSVACSLVVTKNFFERRASANPMYKGKRAGITVLNKDGVPVKRPGCALYTDLGEKLIGGWCEVFVDGREPEYAEVAFSEYNQGFALWKTKPATMIRKVAVSQALREAFPADFGNLYEPEEMGMDADAMPSPAGEVAPCEGDASLGQHETITEDNDQVAPVYEEAF